MSVQMATYSNETRVVTKREENKIQIRELSS